MTWQTELTVSVVSGVLVVLIATLGRAIWVQRRIPSALPRRVRRETYVGTLLKLSQSDDVRSLHVLTPRLFAAREGGEEIARLQEAWEHINTRSEVRVITRNAEECLRGGAELLERGIEVRVAPQLDSENLSYHLFERDHHDQTIINHRQGDSDQPAYLDGVAPLRVFRSHFESVWSGAKPVEAVISGQVLLDAGESADLPYMIRAVRDRGRVYDLGPEALRAVATHVAISNRGSVIFIVGLPGAGKSYVRHRLAVHLAGLRVRAQELTDYVFAYRDFLHGTIRIDSTRGEGFHPEAGGAFRVMKEDQLRPALRSMAEQVWASINAEETILVEFARADIMAALKEFGDDIRRRSQIIYVEAPHDVRAARLRRRARPPELRVSGVSITVTVSDDHRLPSSAEDTLYGLDDVDELIHSKAWQDRVFRVRNDVDDPARIDTAVESFVDGLIAPYLRKLD